MVRQYVFIGGEGAYQLTSLLPLWQQLRIDESLFFSKIVDSTIDTSKWDVKEAKAWDALLEIGIPEECQVMVSHLILPEEDMINDTILQLAVGQYIKKWRKKEEGEACSAPFLRWLQRMGILSVASPPPGKIQRVWSGKGIYLAFISPENEDVNVIHASHTENKHDSCINEAMILLQANLEDTPQEWLGYTMQSLYAAGAKDVSYFSITMKKNRPGLMLQVMCYESQQQIMKSIMFQETTTFGIRYFPVTCHRLTEQILDVKTKWGEVEVKLGFYHGDCVQIAPDFEICSKLAEDHDVPLRKIYQKAMMMAKARL
ncbi:DUF111 family protein [Brevibacillus laterosporus]|uniref:nickel insertion protein n=1 Tax=Brevibacillus laterosporus TaxID=1465 RepID=UPI00035F8C2B|nr:nickel insertion protein [Brevibacillus laterosporus]ATO48869.1 hypothetical protein BrL25_06980 [Brevibacillus laterosporus DSM 25]MBG9799575.1 hypothetical protein [Brevibacillus laterosporus]MBG9801337.1 hypothetical protein [Brevibacillus laterosporus]MCR8939306.1 LarC family nickel insertion protein [Brevibacillus laterosporus]MCZ0841946.1 DUF111 family protein [Brevibacillus laterosporus]